MPNKLALSDAAVKRLPLPASGTTTYWDTIEKGLGVRVSPKGTRTFIALVGSGARQKIGQYPRIGLATARDEARKLLAKKTLGTYEKPNTITWDTAVEKYLKACEDKNRPRTISDYKKHLARFPFKDRRLTTIKKRDVSGVLEGITAKSMKAHVLTSAKAFFSWCANEGYIDASPISALKPPQSQGTAHLKQKAAKPKRALSEAELNEVLSKALAYPYPFGPIVALLILGGQRRQETASYEWEWIAPGTITLPGTVTKNGLEHRYPYGSLTKQVFEAIPDWAKQNQYLFPARTESVRGKPSTVFNGWSKAKKAFDATLKGVKPYKLHDLRRTFTTVLQSLKVPLEVRERLTNHISGTQAGVAGVYNVYGYEAEMKDAIRKYDAFLIKLLRSGNPA
ncbi:hypothetical protein SCH01S_14_00320 [Sphingomonas changbaiensis NBRC 104936]|uniref:Integrase n=1 Tax=Sphingomonas changbaiensis NBRC 104936 TaxID=1219043 RepID=A0A0E9MKS1_9SPHN|nr:hypothetical protein SCH01S_14_00320 [Sphingomonas changbaiensis NBRC 104936]